MADEYTIGDLARQDIYPDETQMQPPQNAVGGLTPEDWMMSGQQPPAATYDYVPPQSWLQKAGDLARRDIATYQQGGAPAMMGQLAEDSSGEQDLAGGFGGNIKGVEGKLGALADLAPHAPPFYSAVEQAVAGAKQNVAPGQQWAGFLRNQPGVKPEEVETLGLGKLFEQPGALSKDAVLGEIAANKVNVGEVVKGKAEGLSDQQLARLDDLEEAMRGRTLTPVEQIEHRDLMLAENAAAGHGVMGATKFHQYTLPGGENYREMLLTLPTQDAAKSARMTELEQKLRNPADYDAPELNSMRQEYKQLADETRDSPSFKSSHFDEPNILAHIRTNDRVIDGKKTLFVEEVQSDWHQKGKREGYKSEPTAEELQEATNRLGRANAAYHAKQKELIDSGQIQTTRDDHPALHPLGKEFVDADNALAALKYPSQRPGVPDAPFKTTWPDLAMKRVIRQAAEGGYDKVAWTPGSVQADRYDLSKHVDGIDVRPRTDAVTGEKSYSGLVRLNNGKVMSVGYGNNGIIDNVGASNIEMKGKHLSDVFGKDIAEKMMSGKSVFDADLKIGGEGMKGFYDQILPAAVNKIVKKAGGRVEQGTVDIPMIRKGGSVGDSPTGVHTLDITPQLREMALKKGFPLFTAGGLVAGGAMGDLAKQDDYQ